MQTLFRLRVILPPAATKRKRVNDYIKALGKGLIWGKLRWLYNEWCVPFLLKMFLNIWLKGNLIGKG